MVAFSASAHSTWIFFVIICWISARSSFIFDMCPDELCSINTLRDFCINVSNFINSYGRDALATCGMHRGERKEGESDFLFSIAYCIIS